MSHEKTTMSQATTSFTLTLDDVEVQAYPGETLWQVAKRAGETIPHLCFKDTGLPRRWQLPRLHGGSGR